MLSNSAVIVAVALDAVKTALIVRQQELESSC